jgi:hypothetical protein
MTPERNRMSRVAMGTLVLLLGCEAPDDTVSAPAAVAPSPGGASAPGAPPPPESAAVDAGKSVEPVSLPNGVFKPGKISSFPLPNIPDAPYRLNGSSKHTNMASIGDRLYVSGGDWLHSATDGTWSMSLTDGSWRKDVGDPVYPTLPAPHALQDGAGFAWSPKRAKFLLWPGSYYPYEPEGSPIREYSKGLWWFDPATNKYTQELGLFGRYLDTTGSLFGGVYDEVNDHIVAFGDDGSAPACRRWDVANLVRLPDIPIKLTRKPRHAVYFARGMHAKIGREVYVIGIESDGTTQTARFFRWHLDQHTFEDLPVPPVDPKKILDRELRVGVSHGRLVWPVMTGPDGDIHGIYLYDPPSATWFLDSQVPSYGSFIGNAVTSLPDGRVAWAGTSFGTKPMTHIWFYEAQ